MEPFQAVVGYVSEALLPFKQRGDVLGQGELGFTTI
jgi:hypothetical protein